MAKNKQFKATITNKREADKYFKQALPNAYRFAMSGTANSVAFEGIKKSNDIFKKEFTLSNNYLIPPKRGQTSLDFLDDQEVGFTHKGMVPTKHAYPGKNREKVIKRNLRRQNIQLKGTRGFPRGIAKTNQQRTLFFLRQMYTQRFAMPGSKQFIYIRPEDQFLNFTEGMYQFSSNTPFGDYGNFPKLKMIYSTEDKVNKKRKATNWMEQSSKSFTQTELDNIWEKEFNKSFTNAIKKL